MSTEATTEAPADKAAETSKGTQSPTNTPSSAPAPAPKVELTVEEYQRLAGLGTQLAEMQKAQQVALEAKDNERIKLIAEKEGAEKALAEKDRIASEKLAAESQRYATLEQQVFSEKKAAVIAQALAGKTFVSASAGKQVQRLLEDSIEVFRGTDGKLSAVDRVTRRDAVDYLKDATASEDYAHHFAATNTQGGAGQQGNRAGVRAESPKPGSLEAIAGEWKTRQDAYNALR